MQIFFMRTTKSLSDKADAQVDFSLHKANMSEDTFSHVETHL